MSDDQILERATQFVAEDGFADPAWRDRARVVLADAVTLALAADSVPGAIDLFELGAGEGRHVGWSSGHRLGAADAVQANSAAACARFQEDNEMNSWSHPGSFVVPAAVAAAIETEQSFGSLLDGLIGGYAMTGWLGGGATVAYGVMKAGRRPSPTFGAAGASAAACRAAGLSAEQTLHAVSAALLVGRGSLHSVAAGGEDWRLHNPGASRDGFITALAARAGMVSGPGALDAEHGFLSVFAGLDEVPDEMRQLPHGGIILEAWQKAFPTLGDNIAVALAAQQLYVPDRADRLDEVVIHMNADFANYPGTQNRPPYDALTSALASVLYVTAHLLLHGTLDFDDYARRDDPAVTDLADRIVVVPHEEYGHLDAMVEVNSGPDRRSYRAEDLPRTKFYRDGDEQRRVAHGLLGPDGAALVDALLDADESAPAEVTLHAALETFHAARSVGV